MKKYTIEEIREYLLSKEDLNSALRDLYEEKIDEVLEGTEIQAIEAAELEREWITDEDRNYNEGAESEEELPF